MKLIRTKTKDEITANDFTNRVFIYMDGDVWEFDSFEELQKMDTEYGYFVVTL